MSNQSIIRTSVRTMYDMQKLRIQMGNRIVAAFRSKLDIKPGESEEEHQDAAELLDHLRKEYKRITDGVTRITKNIKPDSELLTDYGELKLIEAYDHHLETEKLHEKLLEYQLSHHPLWTDYLSHIRGCGTLMAAVIISEIDIKKCNSISALWKFAGIDVVVYTDETTGEIIEEGRCRKKHHLEKKTYINRNGEEIETVGITFNPFLKTKLIGVLGSSFIKLGGHYRDIYDDYKHRLEHHQKHKEKTKGHRHNMAVRYMIKEFLADLWRWWRISEGLPVRPRYNEEKLGIVHSRKSA